MEGQSYPRIPGKNAVNRYKNRGVYDAAFIDNLINTTSVLHVSFVPDPRQDPTPVILPMIGCMGRYDRDAEDKEQSCYLHGYVSSRLMRLGANAEDGLPVCIAATKIDGIVLALTPNSHSYNYRSAVLQGRAFVVEDVDEKVWAMRLITNSVVPDRWENTRIPPDKVEMESTQILRVKVLSASAKVREGSAHDERKDMVRDDVMDRVWTGVVPVYEAFGEPVTSPHNRPAKVPEHVTECVEERNAEGEEYAVRAALED